MSVHSQSKMLTTRHQPPLGQDCVWNKSESPSCHACEDSEGCKVLCEQLQ